MRLRTRPLGALLLFALSTLASAQAPAAQAPASQAPAVDPALTRELEQLALRFAEERKGFMTFRLQAASAEECAELNASFPREEFLEPLASIAERARGTDVAARAWLKVYEIACLLDDRALFTQAVERLLDEHIGSPYMNYLALDLTYGAPAWSRPQAHAALRRILAGTQNTDVRANALAQLALSLGQDEAEASRAEAETLLAAIEQEFGKDDFNGMTGKQFADGARHEMNRLRVGQVAPDFELADQEGVRFKLSDYRGRVVLLDFWGFV